LFVSAVAIVGGLPSHLGKYEILTPLASGGMARIYVGRSTGIGSFERHVVLKMILPERASDPTSVQMFLDEARLAASLNHQNVAQVFEVGEDGGIFDFSGTSGGFQGSLGAHPPARPIVSVAVLDRR